MLLMKAEERRVMGYNALSFGKMIPTFRKIIVSSAVYDLFEPEAPSKDAA
jgi:hypothetical protein